MSRTFLFFFILLIISDLCELIHIAQVERRLTPPGVPESSPNCLCRRAALIACAGYTPDFLHA